MFPFFGPISLEIKKELNNQFSKYFPEIKFNFIFTNQFKIGCFFILKINFLIHCANRFFTNLLVIAARKILIQVALSTFCNKGSMNTLVFQLEPKNPYSVHLFLQYVIINEVATVTLTLITSKYQIPQNFILNFTYQNQFTSIKIIRL